MATTTLSQLVNPEVMADAISAELPAKLATLGYIKVDTTLEGKAGNTITVPRFNYIGSAADLAENTEGSVDVLSAKEVDYQIKKAVKNVELTDESVLSGYGDPVGEVQTQLKNSISDKIDNDVISLLKTDADCPNIDESSSALTVSNLVKAVNDFEGENKGQEKYLLVSPEGLQNLMDDPNLTKSDTLTQGVMVEGAVAKIAGCYVVPSNKLYYGGAAGVTRNAYILTKEAVTAFLKRNVNLETERNVLYKKTLFSVDEHYVVAIEDMNKVRSITHLNASLGKILGSVYMSSSSVMKVHSLYPLVTDAMTEISETEEGDILCAKAYAYFGSSPMKGTFGATKTATDTELGTANEIEVGTDITSLVSAVTTSGTCFMYVAYFDSNNKLRYGSNIKITVPLLK